MAISEKTKPPYPFSVPFDWRMTRVKECCDILDNFRKPLNEDVRKQMPGDIPYYGANGVVDYVNDFLFDEELILIAEDGGNFDEYQTQPIAYVVTGKSWVNNHAHVLRAKKEYFQTYLFYCLEHMNILLWLNGGTRAKLNKGDLEKLPIKVPPLSEQKAIARVLGLIDGAINQNNQLIAQKELRKKWLMQNLLTGKKRLKGFTGEWELKQLGAVAHESAARNKAAMTSVSLMAVTKASGIVPMRERVQGDSVLRCKIIEKDSFAYNPMRLNIGSIARWTESTRAMVSGDYVVFRCDETQLDPNYLDFFRKTNIWTNFVDRAGDGSVRVRIYFSHLKHLKLSLPPLQEQTAIAKVLQAADKEIQLLKTKTEKLREQKKGMMQQLLTGKRRLSLHNE